MKCQKLSLQMLVWQISTGQSSILHVFIDKLDKVKHFLSVVELHLDHQTHQRHLKLAILSIIDHKLNDRAIQLQLWQILLFLFAMGIVEQQILHPQTHQFLKSLLCLLYGVVQLVFEVKKLIDPIYVAVLRIHVQQLSLVLEYLSSLWRGRCCCYTSRNCMLCEISYRLFELWQGLSLWMFKVLKIIGVTAMMAQTHINWLIVEVVDVDRFFVYLPAHRIVQAYQFIRIDVFRMIVQIIYPRNDLEHSRQVFLLHPLSAIRQRRSQSDLLSGIEPFNSKPDTISHYIYHFTSSNPYNRRQRTIVKIILDLFFQNLSCHPQSVAFQDKYIGYLSFQILSVYAVLSGIIHTKYFALQSMSPYIPLSFVDVSTWKIRWMILVKAFRTDARDQSLLAYFFSARIKIGIEIVILRNRSGGMQV